MSGSEYKRIMENYFVHCICDGIANKIQDKISLQLNSVWESSPATKRA